MSSLTGLAYKLGLSNDEIIVIMKKLDIPVDSPGYILTTKDIKKIKKYVRKNNGSFFKDTFVTAVAVLSMSFMFTTIGSSIMSSFNNEVSAPTTSIFIEQENSTRRASVQYYLLFNECRPTDYSETDFLVVENIKVFLSNEGYYTGTVDEVFDTQLVSSVKDFQKDMGIRIDGVIGPTTHKMMQNYDSCSKTSKVDLISCYGGDYKAYLECTSPYGTSGVKTSNGSSQDTEPPKWGNDTLQLTRVNGTFLDILWGHVTDNNGIDKLHLYVDGELHSSVDGNGCTSSCSSTTSETRFRVTNLSVDTSYVFEVVACDISGNCSKNNPTTAQLLVDKPPAWDDSNPPVVGNLGERFDLSIPTNSAIDDIGVVSYEVYVNGALASYTKISDSYFSVLPAFDTTCGKQIVYVVAYDTAGQSSQSQPITFERSECSSLSASVATTTTLPGTPTVTITSSQVSDGDTSADSSITLTFITSASTTNFAAGDVTVSGGTLTNFIGFQTEYAATFTPTGVGATTIDVAANTFTNTATGISNVAATQFNWTYSPAPTITITAAEVNDGDTSNDTSLSVTFTASQSTTNFTAGDVVVSGGTLSNFSGSGTTYTATFTPSAEGATTIDVAANTFTNAFSTNNTAATQFNWTYAVSTKLANCGDSTTNANLWVVAVIDENDGIDNVTNEWALFRTGYPDRCFHLLEPYNTSYTYNASYPNGIGSNLFIPAGFINELSAGTTFHARVNRTDAYNSISGTSDWWDLIGADILPSGAKIGLCIDNSGSMTVTTVQASLDLFEQKAAAAGVTIIPGIQAQNTNYYCINMNQEEWISGLKVNIN